MLYLLLSKNKTINVGRNSQVFQLVCKCVCMCMCVFTDRQQISGICARLLEEVVTMWSLSFDFVLHTYNRFEGEIVAERTERELRVARRGWRPCSHEPWMETESRGELREEFFSTLRYCSKKKCAREGWGGIQKGVRWKVRVRVKTFSPSPFGFIPLGKWVWGGDCQHHKDKVTVGHTLLSLPSLCVCCCVLLPFFPFYLSALCLHLAPCSLYLVAKAFQAASSSLGILEAQQSPHAYTHIP